MSEVDPIAGHLRTAESLMPRLPMEPDTTSSTQPRVYSSWFVWLLQRVFSFPAMLGTMLVGAAFYVGRNFMVDPDVWWHVKVGESILATHLVPTADPYSFTVLGAPWMAYEWLGEILIACASRLGGLQGLDFLLIALSAAITLSLYVFATVRSGNSKAAFLAVTALLLIANASFSLRPQMLGYLFLVLTLIAMELLRQGKSWALWALPPIFLIWVNTHGSFIIGLGVILVYLISGLKSFQMGGIKGLAWSGAERLRLEIIFMLCLAVLPGTPYGSRLAVYPLDMAFSQPVNVANILEWRPMPLELVGGKIFLALLFGFFLMQILFEFVWRLEELVLYFGGTFMAALHVRFILLFVPFFAPIIAVMLARWIPGYERTKDKYIVNAVLMAGLLVATVHYFPSTRNLQDRVAETFPVRALEYLQQHSAPLPMLNTYGYGGYLIAAGQKVFVDGRGDLYERGGVLGDYMHLSQMKPGALAVLDRYGVQSCLVDRDEPMSTLLAASSNWKLQYADSTSALYVRSHNSDH